MTREYRSADIQTCVYVDIHICCMQIRENADIVGDWMRTGGLPRNKLKLRPNVCHIFRLVCLHDAHGRHLIMILNAPEKILLHKMRIVNLQRKIMQKCYST
jgi:hypothetical protein